MPSEHSGCTFFHLLGQIPACESIQLYGGVSQTTEEAISGYQSTLLEQNNGFKPVSASAVQIHYTGSMQWVSSSNTGGGVELFDNKVAAVLTESLERQLAAIYHGNDEQLPVSRVVAQQQDGRADCGLFSIAFPYHSLNAAAIETLSLEQSKLKQHLIHCFDQRKLSPLPSCREEGEEMTNEAVHHSAALHLCFASVI